MDLRTVYPDNVNFYATIPHYTISIADFERYAVERLKLLHIIDKLRPDEIQRSLGKAVASSNLPTYDILVGNNMHMVDEGDLLEARRIDHIAHFLLRLSFARSDEARNWFISRETRFFRFKLVNCNYESVFKKHNLPFENDGQMYKCHFLHAIDLVRSRTAELKNGYAYFPYNELPTVICSQFKRQLRESLQQVRNNFHIVEEDERLRALVVGLEKSYVGSSFTNNEPSKNVREEELDALARQSFPLCMQQLYRKVKTQFHLNHGGRLQLGLFLKGVGLPLSEATKFWRNNFTRNPDISADRFEKQYAYGFRHMYGEEGRRADKTPYSCAKIINSSVGSGDCHGCPFRHSDPDKLLRENLDNADHINEIKTLAVQKRFQTACQRYFEYTHNRQIENISHPNQYFIESQKPAGQPQLEAEVLEIVEEKVTTDTFDSRFNDLEY